MNTRRLRWPDPYGSLVALTGTIVLLEALLRHAPERLEAVIPFIPESTSRLGLVLIGVLLLYLSEQIARRKRSAWIVTIGLLTGLLVVTLTHHFAWWLFALYCTALVYFLTKRRQFSVRSDATSLRRGLSLAGLQLVVAVVVFGVVFTVLDQREFGRHLTSAQTFGYTIDALFGVPFPHAIGATRYDDALIDILRFTALSSLLLAGWSLFRPLRLRGAASWSSLARATAIVTKHAKDSEAHFLLFPHDKHYFFHDGGMIAYGVSNGVALVLDRACGPAERTAPLRQAFLDYCHRHGWRVAVIHSDKEETSEWQTLGFDVLKIGSEAIIDSAVFLDQTVRGKHFRYVRNRVAKDGLRVEFWQSPHQGYRIAELQNISDQWIKNGRQEYAFIMAPFSAEYLQQCEVAVLLDAQSRVLAYANLLPTYAGVSTASIDHMRGLPGISSVAMHALLAHCIEHTYAQGFTYFNLGFVPLAKLETDSAKLSSRVLATLRRLGTRFYSTQGLEQFKGKFEPDWSARYLVYEGGVRQLPLVANALRQLVTYQPKRLRTWHTLPLAFMVLASLLYASFPAAVVLNPPFAFHGLASTLGASGQPYAWFFNLGDIVSAILALSVLAWVYQAKKVPKGPLKTSLIFALISVGAAAIAALVQLPNNPALADGQLQLSLLLSPAIVIHGLASFVNSAAFVLAVVFWFLAATSMSVRKWRAGYLVAVLLIATVGFVLGQVFPEWAGLIQRTFICLYAVWYVLFTYDALKSKQINQNKSSKV